MTRIEKAVKAVSDLYDFYYRIPKIMAKTSRSGDFPKHTNENRSIWNANAEWWDDRIGDGNDFQDELIEPAQERLLDLKPDETVLDVGCGAGRFTRRMAALGVDIVAFDFSEKFIECARKRTSPGMTRIEYRVLDATDASAVISLGRARFDAAVATMMLMDLSCVAPLFRALREVLKPGGRFVFSVFHPCFDTPASAKFAETSVENGRYVVRNGVKIAVYRTPAAWKGEGIVGQPKEQYNFHRSLSLLFGAAFQHGFLIDGFEEPAFLTPAKDCDPLKWKNVPEIPPVLVVRMRLGRR
jgi:2-polyprenyl-3-methyl-5-hydroxy-6-metoxy-1,4-benzoquinol methylase